MSEGLLVRVAIDSTAGRWNAPCSDDGRFCYLPMGSSKSPRHMGTNYDPAYKKYRKFAEQLLDGPVPRRCLWPAKLPRIRYAHFDPDFSHCHIRRQLRSARLQSARTPDLEAASGCRSAVYRLLCSASIRRFRRSRLFSYRLLFCSARRPCQRGYARGLAQERTHPRGRGRGFRRRRSIRIQDELGATLSSHPNRILQPRSLADSP